MTSTAISRLQNDKAYSVLIMDGQLDVHAISQMEQKFEKNTLRPCG